jgi:hypothetical protein
MSQMMTSRSVSKLPVMNCLELILRPKIMLCPQPLEVGGRKD